jgi:hypothetical protein
MVNLTSGRAQRGRQRHTCVGGDSLGDEVATTITSASATASFAVSNTRHCGDPISMSGTSACSALARRAEK